MCNCTCLMTATKESGGCGTKAARGMPPNTPDHPDPTSPESPATAPGIPYGGTRFDPRSRLVANRPPGFQQPGTGPSAPGRPGTGTTAGISGITGLRSSRPAQLRDPGIPGAPTGGTHDAAPEKKPEGASPEAAEHKKRSRRTRRSPARSNDVPVLHRYGARWGGRPSCGAMGGSVRAGGPGNPVVTRRQGACQASLRCCGIPASSARTSASR